jgi:uncharacterized protein YkwD
VLALSAASPTSIRAQALPSTAPALESTETPESTETAATVADADPVVLAGVSALNRYRAAAGLGPVAPDPSSAAPLHAHYLMLNQGSIATAGLRAHTEYEELPGYTPEGAAVAERSNISEGVSKVEAAVQGLVDAPLHRHGLLDPGLGELGVGGEGGFWVFDLGAARPVEPGSPRVVAFPGAGQRRVPLAFPGHETPDPLAAIPGLAPDAVVGYPITLHFYGCEPQGVQEVSLTSGDAPVPIHVVEPGTVLGAEGGTRRVQPVLIFPQSPLQPASAYTVRISAACGVLGPRTYEWQFTTRAALDAGATQIAVGANDSDGWQPVTVRLLDREGLPVEGARITSLRWSFTAPPGGRRPEVREERSESLSDGIVRFAFHLGDAPAAAVELEVAHDGQTVTIPVRVTPAGSGPLLDAPEPGPIPVDPTARAGWEEALGTA